MVAVVRIDEVRHRVGQALRRGSRVDRSSQAVAGSWRRVVSTTPSSLRRNAEL
jgi:hypothetical protein